SSYIWDLSRLYTTGEVTLLALVEPDFDGSGVVDFGDLTRWSQNLGLASGATLAQGDADLDGDVDGNDFLIWQRRLGQIVAQSAPSAKAPESTSLALMAINLAGAVFFSRTMRHRQKHDHPLAKRLRIEPLEPRRLLTITVNTLVDETDGSIVDGDVSLRDA